MVSRPAPSRASLRIQAPTGEARAAGVAAKARDEAAKARDEAAKEGAKAWKEHLKMMGHDDSAASVDCGPTGFLC